uniref:Secreted protein n=1 Tax=Heterorhabditis bacteriophora TaxID=37862 RepID=A0A1I7WDD7_HETBA
MLLPGILISCLCPSKWPCQWGESLLVITLVQCRGAKSLAYDLSVSLYYYPLIGCFVIQGSRNTYIIELIIITIFLSKLKRLYTVCRSKIYIGIYKYQYYWYDLPKIF